MPWIRLDDQFTDHPKVVRAGPLAGWLHVCGLVYCGRYLTDGFIPREMIPRLADFDRVGITTASIGNYAEMGHDVEHGELVDQLVLIGLWEAADGGYYIHDYLEYNPSRAEVEIAKRAKIEAGRRGGMASAAGRQAPARASAQAPAQAKTKEALKQKATPSPSPSPSPDPIPSTQSQEDHSPAKSAVPPTKQPEEQEALSGSGSDQKQLWERARRELEAVMNPTSFKTWIRPIRADPQMSGLLRLLVPTEEIRDWLENRLRPTIGKTLDGVAGYPVEFEFCVRAVAEGMALPRGE